MEIIRVSPNSNKFRLGDKGTSFDILKSILIIPENSKPGSVSVFDGDTEFKVFFGGSGSLSLSDMIPFQITFEAKSEVGPWAISTGSYVSVLAMGDFSWEEK